MINIQQQKPISKQQQKQKYQQHFQHPHPQQHQLQRQQHLSNHQHPKKHSHHYHYHHPQHQEQFYHFSSKEIVLIFKQIIHSHTNILRWNLLTIFLLCNCIDFCISNKISSHTSYSTLNTGSSSSSSSSVSAFEPDFVIPLENVTVAQGRDATFTCVVNNLGGHRVSGDSGTPAKVAWIKADAKAILAIHEHVITNNDRLSVTHNDYNTWTLNIRNVKMEDAGKYMCQVNTDPMKMQTAVLEVVIPPDIINEETSGDMMVPEGGSGEISMSSSRTSKPRITWRRRMALAVEGEMLTLSKVTRSEMGAYMCNRLKWSATIVSKRRKLQVITAVLEVVIPPDIINEETSGDMMVPEGGSAKLVCRARGHPKPRITWRREDGREIIARNGAHQKTKALAVEGEMLTLSKVTRSEMGAYMCIASNGVPPSVSKRMKLQVHFHPLVQVPNQLVGAPVLTDVTLICNVEASPKAINYWQRENGEMIIAGDRYVLTEKEINMYAVEMVLHIKRLQTSDFGGYKCISKNSIGDTEGTIRLYEMERPGKKILREEDMNEVTKNEIVLKENRHEDSARNQNGRLYKERGSDANLYNNSNTGNRTIKPPTITILITLLLMSILLLASTRTLSDNNNYNNHQHHNHIDDRRLLKLFKFDINGL
ncbi:Protein CEPU-1 [Lucilia cuprina]|nr:Protein CEPU-1 [Lucilia cuprina]